MEQASPLTHLFPILVIFLIFYLIVIKPERQKQKEKKDQIASIKKNDEVITIGGIHGTVVNVKEATAIIRIDDNVKIEINKDAIASVNLKT